MSYFYTATVIVADKIVAQKVFSQSGPAKAMCKTAVEAEVSEGTIVDAGVDRCFIAVGKGAIEAYLRGERLETLEAVVATYTNRVVEDIVKTPEMTEIEAQIAEYEAKATELEAEVAETDVEDAPAATVAA